MTPNEALAAVKRAVDQWQNNALSWDILVDAIRAIAPGGPLVVVPREPTKEMQVAGMQAFIDAQPPLKPPSDGEVLSENETIQRYMALGSRTRNGAEMLAVYRAMIAEVK